MTVYVFERQCFLGIRQALILPYECRNLVAKYGGRSQRGRKMGNRKSTKYPGVQARESKERRYRGRPDICYTIDYRDATGKRIRKDVGWASQGFSAALASEMRATLIHEAKKCAAMGCVVLPAKSAPTFLEAWNIYRKDWLEANGKRSSYDQSLVDGHLKPLQEKPLNTITVHDLDRIMGSMRQMGSAAQTIRLALGLVKRVFRRMTIWKLYAGPLPFDGLVLPKLNNSRIRFLSPDEARAIMDELKKRNYQAWLMALISLHCGLRFGEIAHLCWGDIDIPAMTIHIREAKSGYGRHAVMTTDVAEALSSLSPGAPSDLVFSTGTGGAIRQVSDSFATVVKKLGLNNGITDRRQKIVFHTLRHTYASWLAKSGQGQLVIADRLGHRTLEMTKRYTHLMDETRKASADAISNIFHGDPPESQS